MSVVIDSTLEHLIPHLNSALAIPDKSSCTLKIKDSLEAMVREGQIQLPDRFRKVGAGAYARRLLFRCPDTGCTAIVMCWGPGQETCLHDHSGMWCVECVIEGGIDVVQYNHLETHNERYRFAEGNTIQCSVGQAGTLIPPTEFHVLRNNSTEHVCLTLHIYEGEMTHCHVFEPEDEDGWFVRKRLPLSYDA